MDTTTNELQALRQELDAFRKETVAMFNELAKHHALLNNSINFTNSQNLKIYLTRLAGMQTAQFIADNMPKVKSFDNRSDYLKYVINHTESVWGGVFGIRRLRGRNHKSPLVDVARQNYLRLRQL